MAGGTYEFVSGELSTSSSQSTSSNAEYILNPVRPPYVDLYVIKANGFDSKAAWSYDDEGQYYNIDRCTWEECGGHDLHETKRFQAVSYRNISWDENQSYFAFANYPWFPVVELPMTVRGSAYITHIQLTAGAVETMVFERLY